MGAPGEPTLGRGPYEPVFVIRLSSVSNRSLKTSASSVPLSNVIRPTDAIFAKSPASPVKEAARAQYAEFKAIKAR